MPGARIFHVEDGRDYARDLHARLTSLGHEVVFHAATMADALALVPDAIRDAEVNLAILDRDLPDGSGITVAAAIRATGLDVPIIANSGYETTFGDWNVTKLERSDLLDVVAVVATRSAAL